MQYTYQLTFSLQAPPGTSYSSRHIPSRKARFADCSMSDGWSLSNISGCLFSLLFLLPLSLDFVSNAYTQVISFNRKLFTALVESPLCQNCHFGLISLFHYFLGVAIFFQCLFSILFSLEDLVASSNGFPLSSAGKKGGRHLERKNVELYLLKNFLLVAFQ